jgi:hypothetical protein
MSNAPNHVLSSNTSLDVGYVAINQTFKCKMETFIEILDYTESHVPTITTILFLREVIFL